MKFHYTLPAAIIGVSIAFVQSQVATAVCSNKQVDEIAEKITVLIDSQKPGSGVIINRNGSTYTVLTAYHVVNKPNLKYEVVTFNNQRYQLNYQTVKRLDNNVDLAIVRFTSNKKYQIFLI
ncbi:serine protease [Nostoc sp. CHAB 5844]|nr:serine protease [Nostoc sp. CHAB 5844]